MSSSAPPPLMLLLREETRALHEAAEQAGFMKDLMSWTLSRERLVAAMGQLWLLHTGFNERLNRLRESDPAAARVLKDYHFLAPGLLRADLKFWECDPATHAPAPRDGVRAFLAEADKWAELDPPALLGMFYVLEGSLNGAKIIGARLREHFHLSGAEGLSHLDPHGALQRERWREFAEALNAAAESWSEDRRRHVVEAAQAAFRCIGILYKGV